MPKFPGARCPLSVRNFLQKFVRQDAQKFVRQDAQITFFSKNTFFKKICAPRCATFYAHLGAEISQKSKFKKLRIWRTNFTLHTLSSVCALRAPILWLMAHKLVRREAEKFVRQDAQKITTVISYRVSYGVKCQKAEKEKKNLRILAHKTPTSRPRLFLRILAHKLVPVMRKK